MNILPTIMTFTPEQIEFIDLVKNNQVDRLKGFLSEHRATIDVDIRFNQSNETALMHASQWGFVEVLRVLLDHGANTLLMNTSGQNCLFVAGYSGQIETFKILVPLVGLYSRLPKEDFFEWDDPKEWRTAEGDTVLHTACLNVDNLEMVKYILSLGVDIDITGKRWCRPIHRARNYSYDNVSVVKYLIEQGCLCERPCISDDGLWTSDIEIYKGWNIQNLKYLKQLSEIVKRKLPGMEVGYYILSYCNSKNKVCKSKYSYLTEETRQLVRAVESDIPSEFELLRMASI